MTWLQKICKKYTAPGDEKLFWRRCVKSHLRWKNAHLTENTLDGVHIKELSSSDDENGHFNFHWAKKNCFLTYSPPSLLHRPPHRPTSTLCSNEVPGKKTWYLWWRLHEWFVRAHLQRVSVGSSRTPRRVTKRRKTVSVETHCWFGSQSWHQKRYLFSFRDFRKQFFERERER